MRGNRDAHLVPDPSEMVPVPSGRSPKNFATHHRMIGYRGNFLR